MCMTSVHGTINGSAYAIWLAMLCGTSTKTDHGCTSSPIFMRSLRSQPLSSTLRLKNTTREQHECTNLMHSDLEAIFLSTFILISQNRQNRMSELRNHLDLQINLLSEQLYFPLNLS